LTGAEEEDPAAEELPSAIASGQRGGASVGEVVDDGAVQWRRAEVLPVTGCAPRIGLGFVGGCGGSW